MSIPKILVSAVLFGVIAAGCFFGVNKGLSALLGTDSEIQGVDNSSNNGVALTTVSGSASGCRCVRYRRKGYAIDCCDYREEYSDFLLWTDLFFRGSRFRIYCKTG